MITRNLAAAVLAMVVAASAGAPLLTPHDPIRQFADYENAPPMPLRLVDASGRVRRPFVYPIALADRLERRFAEDRSRPIPVRFFSGGVVMGIDETVAPWFPLGTDPLGRDVLSRLSYGSRLSLGLAAIAALGTTLLGLLIGATAGFIGGRTEALLMTLTDFVLVLPAVYVVLAFRAALPLVLSVEQVFGALALVLVLAGWPITARGVRAIVAGERVKEYAEAAKAAGAGPVRILLRHLAPAAAGFLTVSGTLMVPAFILTEATMSLVGLGFPIPTPTWGTMMREAWQGGALADAPWLMAPAAAIAVTVLALHTLASGRPAEGPARGTFL